ncbi:MAG TPA: gephyrin-like molybdotransferase Glp [Anaeromyxobacter sp.]|nr:gephyrin-like molybdotransferase Glp [Anaeromyxobacter sp.]
MPSFDEARRIILENVVRLGAEVVPALDAVGRVVAEDVTAPSDLPRWDNSAMDGFALRAQDAAAPGGLRVSGYVPAGATPSGAVGAGTAVRILTGAPLPPGADTVVPVEHTEERDGTVRLLRPVAAGANVRRRGEDIRAGEAILPAGTVVGPAELSALASSSRLAVPVVRRARVAILSTGDELVEPGAPLAPGLIHDSNGWALAAAVRQAGAEPAILGIARDDREALRRLLREGLAADALVTSAGVSVGDRDLVREVLDELGTRQLFWKVDIKPGRPTAFALAGRTPVFSLPGNPVATLLTFDQLVRPALLRMMGHARVLRPLVPARLRDGLSRRPGRVEFVRVRLERTAEGLVATSAGDQATGMLKTLLRADGLVVVPADRGSIEAGGAVEVQVLRGELERRED